MRARALVASLLATASLAGCNQKAALEGSRVEMMTVEGRRFEVRSVPTGQPDEFRLLVVRGTLVVNPDPELEYKRAWNVARRVMDERCRGRPYKVLDDTLVDTVNLQVRFVCLTG